MEDEKLIKAASYIIQAAETASNLARVDGVTFTPAEKNAKSIDELYKKTRSQYFDYETKKLILLGNFIMSKGNYEEYFLKAKKIVSAIAEKGGELC